MTTSLLNIQENMTTETLNGCVNYINYIARSLDMEDIEPSTLNFLYLNDTIHYVVTPTTEKEKQFLLLLEDINSELLTKNKELIIKKGLIYEKLKEIFDGIIPSPVTILTVASCIILKEHNTTDTIIQSYEVINKIIDWVYDSIEN